jgi:DNA-binding CsgD family transcriptional regulator
MFGMRTSGQLARELGMPHHRVSRALDELVAVEAVRPVATGAAGVCRTRSWEPVAVDRVLHRLRRRREPPAPAERWRRHVATVSGVHPSVMDGVATRHWPTRAATRRRVAALDHAERHEHLAINTEEVFEAEAIAAALPLDRGKLARGVRLRVLGLPPSDGDRSCAYADALGGADGMYRELPDLPLKLQVFDRRVALFPFDPLDLERGYVEVRDAEVVRALAGVFDGLWRDARDPRRGGIPPIELTPRERALLRLLAMGHTDHSAAAELRLSVRTIAYTIRGLLDRLGVETRFQLALLLGTAGVVPVPGHGPQDLDPDDPTTT